MKRNFVKAGLASLSVVKKIALGNSVASGLDGNPLIPGATAVQTAVATATTNLTDARNAATSGASAGSHVAEQAMLISENEFDTEMHSAILFVQGVADAASSPEESKEIILSSGFGVRKTPEVWTAPEPVKKLKTVFTNHTGEILVKWTAGKFSKFFFLYHRTSPGNSWELVDTTSKKKSLQTGLTAGTHYFMVVSVNNAGTSVDSVTVDGVCK